MFCKYCGKEIDNDSVYCAGCGNHLYGRPSYGTAHTQPVYAPPPPPHCDYGEEDRPDDSVNLFEAVRLYYVNAFNFSGRSVRSEYWWIVVYNMLITLPLYLFSIFLQIVSQSNGSPKLYLWAAIFQFFSLVLSSIWSIIHIVPGISLSIRRLHDVGKSGWWYFIMLAPCIGYIYFIVLLCTDSDDDNRWGLSPYYYQDPPQTIVRQAPPADEWFCECGRRNYTQTCANCGQPMPVTPKGYWKCMGCGIFVPNHLDKCSCGYHR